MFFQGFEPDGPVTLRSGLLCASRTRHSKGVPTDCLRLPNHIPSHQTE